MLLLAAQSTLAGQRPSAEFPICLPSCCRALRLHYCLWLYVSSEDGNSCPCMASVLPTEPSLSPGPSVSNKSLSLSLTWLWLLSVLETFPSIQLLSYPCNFLLEYCPPPLPSPPLLLLPPLLPPPHPPLSSQFSISSPLRLPK